MIQKTFAIIKPDIVAENKTGKIIDIIEKNDFEILGMKKIQISKEKAELFYDVHQDKPFFDDLIKFIISGPVIVLALKKENAIKDWRTLMGATDPLKAEEGTIRKQFGKSIDINAVHGSDSPETAEREISLFFPDLV